MGKLKGLLRRPGAAKWLGGGISALVFGLALFVLHRTIGRFDAAQVWAMANGYPPAVLGAALALSALSYLSLSGFDLLALKHLRRPLPTGWTMLISFVSHGISHNAGFAILSGGSVRLRMYSTFGLSLTEVAGVITFAGLTFALGTAALAGLAFILEYERIAPLVRLPSAMVAALGWLMAAALAGYLVWTGMAHRPLAVGMWRFSTPSLPLGLAQIVVAATDLALVAGALYVLLPGGGGVTYPSFVGLYVVATLAGIISHVPGGLGVFEGALLLLLPRISANEVLGALLVFRVFYNLLPLVLAATILTVFEVAQRLRHAAPPPWLTDLGPALTAVVAFGAGTILLVSGAVGPASTLPPLVAEPAHLLSGATGAALLLAAWSLARPTIAGWRMSLALLGIGAVLAALRGPDWGVAAILIGAAAVLGAASPLFRLAADPEPPPLGWMGAAAAVIAGAFWLTLHGHGTGMRPLRADALAALTLGAAWWASYKTPEAEAGRTTNARPP